MQLIPQLKSLGPGGGAIPAAVAILAVITIFWGIFLVVRLILFKKPKKKDAGSIERVGNLVIDINRKEGQ